AQGAGSVGLVGCRHCNRWRVGRERDFPHALVVGNVAETARCWISRNADNVTAVLHESADVDRFVILVKGEIPYPATSEVRVKVGIRVGLRKIISGIPSAANGASPRELLA